MHFLADILLAFKDFLSGTISKTLGSAASWASATMPWGMVIGAMGIFAGGATSAIAIGGGLFAVPLAAAALGATWGLLTGGVQEVVTGMGDRRLNRQNRAEEQAVERQQTRTMAPMPAPIIPEEPLDLQREYASPDLAFRETRPGTRIINPQWQGKCIARPTVGQEMMG